MTVSPAGASRAVAARPAAPRQRNALCGAVVAFLGLFAATSMFPRDARAQYVGQLSTFAIDAKTGAVLSESNSDLQRYPASLTKLMTLYMAFRALHEGKLGFDQLVPVSIHSSVQEPSKLGLVPGTRLTVEQAILGLVTKSANDAACALGELIGGGDEQRFAEMMTQEARSLGMTRTTFRNASGLPNSEQVTTARDLAILAQHIIADYPEDYHYFSVPTFMFHGRAIPNHNPMLRFYPGADGMKTGYTAEAGLNLVTSAQRDNVRLVGVVLGASSNLERSRVMAAMLDHGFDAEGVAPVARGAFPMRGVVMARATLRGRRRNGLMFAAANASAKGMPVEVAEVPAPSAHHRRGHIAAQVHLVSAHSRPASATHTVHAAAHPAHKGHKSRT